MREAGYYWVKFDGVWEVAEFRGEFWARCGDPDKFISEELSVGPRITPPAEGQS